MLWGWIRGFFASSLGELLLLDRFAPGQVAKSPEIRRHVLFEGVTRRLRAAGERQPVCVLLDDLQWAHGAVFEVLDFLVEGLIDVAEGFVELAGQATLFAVPHPDYEALGEYHAGLGLVEQFFCRTGRPEQFRAFCRAIQKRERDRGVRVEGAWWAELAEPKWEGWQRLEAGDWAEDWLWEDPHGVCRYAVEEGGLVICATEILGFNELTFPRLVRELDGDFAVEVEIGGAEEMEAGLRQRLTELRAGRLDRALPFPAAGGLVARNAAGDAVRLGVHMQGSGDVLFDGRVRKARPIYGRTWIEGGRIRLRLERTGDVFRAYCRSAAGGWLCLGEVEAPLGRRVWVGPCAEIPTQYLHMVRRAEACFAEFRLYCPAADLDSAYEQELLMLRELAEVVVDGEGSLEGFEHGVLGALARSVGAEWGQRVEADSRGRWKVRLQWGARDEEGLDELAEASGAKELLQDEVLPLIERFLKPRGLEVSPEKTQITHIEEGFDFLGQHIRKYKGKLRTKPSKKSVHSLLEKIRKIVQANKQAKTGNMIARLNPLIRGWANYHRHAASKKTFGSVDNALFKLLWQWAKRRHPQKSRKWIKEKYFKSFKERNWVFSGETTDGKELQLTRAVDVAIKRHTKIRGDANPYDPEEERYFDQRLGGVDI